jgi:long-chain fatty acid transport protein
MALGATSAFATNGDHLIGTGAKARGMGGIGIGMSHGAESALTNPALITSVKGTEISFGGTVFMPDVAANMGAGASNSDADMSVIPEVSIATNLGDGWSVGVGMFGTAGMGTDYRDATGNTFNMNMVTNLQLMQFAVPVAYKTGDLSIGIAPVMQYGSLDITYDTNTTNPSTTDGVAQDFGFGINLGVAYEMDNLTVGASYKSSIDMTYKGQIKNATTQFAGLMGTAILTDDLEQPAEYGVGLSYVMGEHTIAADYKRIKWSSAKGYKDFKWDDQNVYMLGYSYMEDNWALRAGYNYAKSPIKQQPISAGAQSHVDNVFNLLGFPGIVEKHYTVGGTYEFSKLVSMDVAYVYSPEVTETFAIFNPNFSVGSITTTHSQDAVSVQVNFNF